MSVIVLNNQSLLDIAIQEFGSAAAAYNIAIMNDLNITDNLKAGQILELPTVESVGSFSRPIANYYKSRGLKPATAITGDKKRGVFSRTFSRIFN
jgi:hypothetical protein